MGGSEDDKKAKLTTESQNFEDRLEKMTELLDIILVLIEEQLSDYHRERVQYYTNALQKAVNDELGVAKAIMDFHIYEYQLFAKERRRKVEQLMGAPP